MGSWFLFQESIFIYCNYNIDNISNKNAIKVKGHEREHSKLSIQNREQK